MLAGRSINLRNATTCGGKGAIDRMVLTANRMEGKRLKDKELVA